MAMDLGGRGGVRSDINVTPLVDVMLVLLIIVMLVAPMIEAGVNLTLPTAANSASKPQNPEQTVVAVAADGRIYLNSLEVSEAELPQRVTEVLETKDERIVLIKADQDAQYGRVMAAMDALRKAQVEDMGLVTDPHVDEEETAGDN